MNEDDIIEVAVIEALENVLIEEEEAEHALGLLIGRMGARIMGMLEDGDELLGDDYNEEVYWEKVEVDVEGYRIMGDPSFQRHFRLSKPTFEALVHVMAHHLIDSGKVVRVRTPIDVPLLMVLWILANPDTFRSVALRFGVLPSVVHFHYLRIIESLRELAPRYIQWPSEEERYAIKTRFEAYSGFPGIVGAIDGTHNLVTAPLIQKESFRNRHHTYSFNTMVLCDDNLLIRDLHIGEVGSMHDQRVFRRSPLFRRLVNDPQHRMLNEDEHIVGDTAYALMDSVMVPFRNAGNLTPQQRNFNYRLCKCRARIEHCFGLAFGQWRRMKMLHSCNIEIAVDHFTASYVLQNFRIINGEQFMDLDDDGPFDDNDEGENGELHEDEAEDIVEGGLNFNQFVVAARHRGREKRAHILNNL